MDKITIHKINGLFKSFAELVKKKYNTEIRLCSQLSNDGLGTRYTIEDSNGSYFLTSRIIFGKNHLYDVLYYMWLLLTLEIS